MESNEKMKGQIFSRRYYKNGAHAGNIKFLVEGWGMNNRLVEDEISQRLNDFISSLTFEHTVSIGSVNINCAHSLTNEQVKEWADLKEIKKS